MSKRSKLPLTYKQFDYINKNKIDPELEEKGQFRFKDMNVLFNAYEYWRYDQVSKQKFRSSENSRQSSFAVSSFGGDMRESTMLHSELV
jgi:hypothetical protein